jgi:hypothetical protein
VTRVLLLQDRPDEAPVRLPGSSATAEVYASGWRVGEAQFRAAATLSRQAEVWRTGRMELTRMIEWVEALTG